MGNLININKVKMDFLNQFKIENSEDGKMSLVITIDSSNRRISRISQAGDLSTNGSETLKLLPRSNSDTLESPPMVNRSSKPKAAWLEKFHQHKHRDLCILCFVCIPIAVGLLCFMVWLMIML